MKYLLAVLSLAFLAGCKSDPNVEMFKKVDALVAQVDSVTKDLAGYEADPLAPLADTIGFNVKFIHQEYQDTLKLNLATRIDVYYRIIKSINKYSDAYSGQMKDLEYSKKQLFDLKNDIKTGIVDTTGFGIYYPMEKDAVDRLMESTEGLKSWHKNINDSYSRLKTPVDSFIAVIKEQRGY